MTAFDCQCSVYIVSLNFFSCWFRLCLFFPYSVVKFHLNEETLEAFRFSSQKLLGSPLTTAIFCGDLSSDVFIVKGLEGFYRLLIAPVCMCSGLCVRLCWDTWELVVVCMFMCVRTCMGVCVCVWVCVCVCVCV